MKKVIITLIVIAILVVGGLLWWNNSIQTRNQQAKNNTSNYQIKRSSVEKNNNKISSIKEEVEIARFSTKIYNKDTDRQNNIGITCRAVSTKEVNPGEVFSFCETVGKATHAKGYEEADIYVDGKKEQGLGGGNCQVSTTLYNAVLQIPELEVIERHQHS